MKMKDLNKEVQMKREQLDRIQESNCLLINENKNLIETNDKISVENSELIANIRELTAQNKSLHLKNITL